MLTHLAGNLEGPCVLAVDAAWGTGKTTFIGMWSQHLRNQGFPVVPFNAWETDFSGDPLLTLTSELTEGLHEYPGEPLATKIADTKKSEGSCPMGRSGCNSLGNSSHSGCGLRSRPNARILCRGQTV